MSEKPSSEVFDAYMKAMQEFRAELDPLIPALLHTHLYAEHLLGRIIEHKLSGNVEDILKGRSPRFYFSHKLQLVIALDVLDEGLVEALWTLNELRNGAAHTKEFQVADEKLQKIGEAALGQKQYAEIHFVATGRTDRGDLVFYGTVAELAAVVTELETTGQVKSRQSLT